MNNTLPSPRPLRTDIQALRGFAVLIVLLYHAKLGVLANGYLGVDIFFVISGFLITQLIKSEIERGTFQFSKFYWRRAKRLLPAAYVTFFFTLILAPFILTSAALNDLRTQVLGAVTFTSNIVLWRQSGYFAAGAELKPLLHTWSLAIEEQFYLVLPAMLFFIPRRFWLKAAVLALLTSLLLCFLMVQLKPTAAFYLLPFRAWELIIGALGALIIQGDHLKAFLKLAFWPALTALVSLPFIPYSSLHPGPGALIICAATLVVLLRNHPRLSQGVAIKATSKIGDISYSLYLVHWPIFAFFNNIWIGDADDHRALFIRIGLIALSLLLAWLLHRFIEEPLRHKSTLPTKASLLYIATSTLTLIVIASALPQLFKSDLNYTYLARPNYGLAESCNFKDTFKAQPECTNSEAPEILVWGDSFAMHIVPGIIQSEETKPLIIQATKSSCAPLLGLANKRVEASLTQSWAETCIAFNDSVVDYLNKSTSIHTVVLASPFASYLSDEYELLKKNYNNNSYQLINTGKAETLKGLTKTIDAIRASGKKVVIIAPPPSNGRDTSICLERFANNLFSLGTDNCNIAVKDYNAKSKETKALLTEASLKNNVGVIRFDSYLCNSAFCTTHINNAPLYRDAGHLSYTGSAFLGRAISLREKINQEAK